MPLWLDFLGRSGLPLDIAVPGVSRSQLAKCYASGNEFRSGPTSCSIDSAYPPRHLALALLPT